MATELVAQHSEQFIWLVEYADGTRIAEYDEERPDGRGFMEVEPEGIRIVYLLDPDPRSEISYRVLIPYRAAPVFLRRRLIQLQVNSEGESVEAARGTAHCIGWKQGEQGVFLFVFPNGSTVLTDDYNAI